MLFYDPARQLLQLGRLKGRVLRPWDTIERSGLSFLINAFTIDGFGNCSMIRMRAPLGPIQMESMILTPLHYDLPLLSYDYIHAPGKDKLLLELYDTQLAPIFMGPMEQAAADFPDLPDERKKPHWSNDLLLPGSASKAAKGKRDRLRDMTAAWLDAYLELAKTARPCARAEKQAAVRAYVDRLMTEGGVAVDQFKKLLGDETADQLLRQYIFSSDDPRSDGV